MERLSTTRIRRSDLLGLIAFFGIGLALTWAIGGLIQGRVKASAEERASLLVNVALTDSLSFDDVVAPVAGPRRERLITELEQSLLDADVVGLRVRRFDGVVLLSLGTTARGIAVDPASDMTRAFEGRAVTESTTDTLGRKLLASYVPLGISASGDASDVVAEVYQDEGLASAGFRGFERMLIALALAALAALYLTLVKLWRDGASEPEPLTYRVLVQSAKEARYPL